MLSASLASPHLSSSPPLSPFFTSPPLAFSPYAVGGHEDERDEQQHPDSDKDAREQELGGRVLSCESRQNKRDKDNEKGAESDSIADITMRRCTMPMHGGRTRERDDMKEVYYIKKFSIQGHQLQRKDRANKF